MVYLALQNGELIMQTTFAFEWDFATSPSKDIEDMAWNYRVIYSPKNEDLAWDTDTFSIREVFYNDDGDIEYWSDENAEPFGATFEELAADFDLMAEAFERPILMTITTDDGIDGLIELSDED
jgi:hypothetical protein